MKAYVALVGGLLVVLGAAAAATADECPSLAMAYAVNPTNMNPTSLTSLKRCIDATLKENQAAQKRAPSMKQKPTRQYRHDAPARSTRPGAG